MEGRTPEHLNMDSAAGNMPPQPVPNRLKQKPPKGELNPYTKHTAAPHQSEKIQKKHASGKEMEEAQLKGNWAKSINLFNPGEEKQAIIADKALEEVTKVSEEELQKRDKQIFQTWVQQNPVQAALLGIDQDDPFEEKKGNSPLKYYKKSPLKAQRNIQSMGMMDALRYGQEINRNRMQEAGIAGTQHIQEKMAQWDQERKQHFEKLKAQKDREAKEMLEASKPLVQAMDNSAALDESTKQLMAQQWKQKYVENEKKYKAGEIDQYEYGLNKQQSLNNAQQYGNAVNNITAAAKQYGEALASGQISDGMKEDARDFYTTLASGKGLNVQISKDPETGEEKRVTTKGLSIQNDPNGNPTLMGYTSGQEEAARKVYEQLTQDIDPITGQPKLNKQETTFDAWFTQLPRTGDPKLQEFLETQKALNQQRQAEGKQPLDYESWINGVNIPVANLANGEGMPAMLMKDEALGQNITSYADTIADQALNNASYPGSTNTDQLWEQADEYATEYLNQMVGGMNEQQLRALASDYLEMTPTEMDRIQNTEGGIDALKEKMIDPLKQAVKQRFESNPKLAILNKEYRAKQDAMAKQANAAALRGTPAGRQVDLELQQQMANALSKGEYQAFVGTVGKDKITEIKRLGDNRSLWEKYAPNAIGGESAPAEPMYRIEINGERQEMPESEMRQYLMRAGGIKGSMMGESEEQPTETPAPTDTSSARSKLDEYRKRLAEKNQSPAPKRSKKAYPIDDKKSWMGALYAYAKKHGNDKAIKTFGKSAEQYLKATGGTHKGRKIDALDYGITDQEHQQAMEEGLFNKPNMEAYSQAGLGPSEIAEMRQMSKESLWEGSTPRNAASAEGLQSDPRNQMEGLQDPQEALMQEVNAKVQQLLQQGLTQEEINQKLMPWVQSEMKRRGIQ